jgi:hypothetical protein
MRIGDHRPRIFQSMSALVFLLIPVLFSSISCSLMQPAFLRPPDYSLRIQAEDYDVGGEGTAYHDTTLGNAGKEYLGDDVDIESCKEGGYNVGWIEKGEWLRFSNIQGHGREYYISARVASENREGAFRIEINGTDATGLVTFPPTGGFQKWTTVDAGVVTLTPGFNTIRLVSEADSWNVNWIAFNTSKKAASALHIPPKKPEENPRMLVTLAESALKHGQTILGQENLKKVGAADPEGKLLLALTRKAHVDELEAHGVAFDEATTTVPYKYLLDGFLDRMEKPTPVDDSGRIIANDGYHDNFMVENLLTAFANRYPAITSLHNIGETWQGQAIWALKISDNPAEEEDEPAYLFIAAHHASELLSTEFVLDIIEYLTANYNKDERVRTWVDSYEIWCVPLANPDGCFRFFHVTGSGRKNGRDTNNNGKIDPTDGVDLNRNYPFRWHTLGERSSKTNPEHYWYRGPAPASEPETQAIMHLADEQRFVMLISFHTAATRILVPYTIDNVKNPEPSVAWMVGEKIAALSDSHRKDRKYKAVRNLYSVDGTDQDWHYWKYGTLAYIWEGPRHNPPFERDRDKIVEGARPGWGYMLDRLRKGPTLSGNVLDAETGAPLEAVITLDEIKTFEGEIHTSHPATGRFDRILPRKGTYHIHFTKEGYLPKSVEVKVGREWKTITVYLVPE